MQETGLTICADCRSGFCSTRQNILIPAGPITSILHSLSGFLSLSTVRGELLLIKGRTDFVRSRSFRVPDDSPARGPRSDGAAPILEPGKRYAKRAFKNLVGMGLTFSD